MGTKRFIENNVLCNRRQLGYMDSVNIPRCCAGLGFGIVDVTLLPLRRPKRLCWLCAHYAALCQPRILTLRVMGSPDLWSLILPRITQITWVKNVHLCDP